MAEDLGHDVTVTKHETHEAVPAKREEEVLAGGAALMTMGGAATVALCVIALVGRAPRGLMSVAAIVAGGTLLLGATGMGARARAVGGMARRVAGGGAGVEFIGGAAGVVLGILALIGLGDPVLLCGIAALALGGAVLLSAILPARPGVYGIHEGAPRRTVEGTSGVQGLAGIGSVTLAILALAGVLSVYLTLISLLGVGAAMMLTGSALLAGSALTARSQEV